MVGRTIIRRAFRRIGFDVHRYPNGDGLARLLDLLGVVEPVLFIDAGASIGEYGTELRSRGFRGPIASIEPVSSVFAKLRKRALKDGKWSTYNCALGEISGQATIHVSANNAESSSLLKISSRHLRAYAQSETVGEEVVPVCTLGELFGSSFSGHRIALKLDVQGFELQVLEGARTLFENGRIAAVQIEVSLTPLYEGGAEPPEIHQFLTDFGFELVYVKPGFSDSKWRLLQSDFFYFKF